MIKIECPFICLFGDDIKCPYIENFTHCHNIETAPGNGDAWCSEMIEIALNKTKEEPFMRQNYSCSGCGLKSSVTYSSIEDSFAIVIKIREDHKNKSPHCDFPLDDMDIIGDPKET